jgi:hypothetical protein
MVHCLFVHAATTTICKMDIIYMRIELYQSKMYQKQVKLYVATLL